LTTKEEIRRRRSEGVEFHLAGKLPTYVPPAHMTLPLKDGLGKIRRRRCDRHLKTLASATVVVSDLRRLHTSENCLLRSPATTTSFRQHMTAQGLGDLCEWLTL